MLNDEENDIEEFLFDIEKDKDYADELYVLKNIRVPSKKTKATSQENSEDE